MPEHLEPYQAQRYVASWMKNSFNTSKEYKLPFFAVGNNNNPLTNMDIPQLQELKQTIDQLILKKETVKSAQRAVTNLKS